MKIKELKDGMTRVELNVTVKSIDAPKEVTTKFGTNILLRRAMVEDDSGEMSLTIWGPEPQVSSGNSLHITGGVVKDFRGQLQLSVGRDGKIEVVNV